MANSNNNKAPAYFISHGGPSFMFMKESGAFKTVVKIGNEIKNVANLKGIVVVCAHWESTNDEIYVNTAEQSNIIYDFDRSRWPSHYFDIKYPNIGSDQISKKILNILRDKEIKVTGKSRGLDHGVWVPFSIAFPPKTNPLNVPIVQVSIYQNENSNLQLNLGEALSELRKDGIVIIGSGMTVHNLDERDVYAKDEVASYTKPFDDAVISSLTKNLGADRRSALLKLLERKDCRLAHPTREHLYPLFVVAASALEDPCELLFTELDRSFAWGQYRFG